MSVYKMNSDQTFKFVKLYHEADCLWQMNSEHYKNRRLREEAAANIARQMNIDGFGVREVAQKIKNIRSAYHQEVKKIAHSEKFSSTSGGIYRPKVPWFPLAHSFLKGNNKIKNLSFNHDTIKPPEEVEFIEVPSISEPDQHSPAPFQPHSSNMTRLQDQCSPPSYFGEDIEQVEYNKNDPTSESEFDIWCRSLAKQLNNMETLRALNLQMQIQNLLSRERIAHEKQKNFLQSTSTRQPTAWTYDTHPQHDEISIEPENIPKLQKTIKEDSEDAFLPGVYSTSSDSIDAS